MNPSRLLTHKIIPGILENSWGEIEKKIELVKSFSDTIHIDVIDGKFVQNQTFFDPAPFQKYTNSIFFELHMMVEEPTQYIKPWAQVGFKRFFGHVEKMSNQEEFVAQAQLYGEAGLALDGPSGTELIKVPLDDLDCVLIYTGEHVGKSGGVFLQESMGKIEKLRSLFDGVIEADGGVDEGNIQELKNAGVNQFVSTHYIFEGDTAQNYANLTKILGKNSPQ